MPNETETSRLRLFEVVAFGCHERAHRQLSRVLAKVRGGIRTFLFIEYFCIRPIPYVRWREKIGTSRLFFPFIRRLVDENQFIWVEDRNWNFRLFPKSADILDGFADPAQFTLSPDFAMTGRKVLAWWADHGRWSNSERSPIEDRDKRLIVTYTEQEWAEHLRWVSEKPRKESVVSLKEFGLAAKPWQETHTAVDIYGFPIATDAIFYGYFILVVPTAHAEETRRLERERLWKHLGDLADREYLPVLILLAESLLNEDLLTRIEESKAAAWRGVAKEFIESGSVAFICCDSNPPEADKHGTCPNQQRRYEDNFELPLHRLWARRKLLLEKLADKEEDYWKFAKSLPFAKYFVASPGLVEQLRKVMTSDFLVPDERGSLHSALVYGGPGSGKEIMAQMVPLFSNEYFFNEVHTVNMAAVRPDAATGPLLQGIRVFQASENKTQDPRPWFTLDGLLIEAQRKMKAGCTFILDELNSLQVDLQGILLRILEQGEVMPLFSLDKEYVQHLVVAIVNEDPELISRESELRELLVEKGKLGTLFSGLLYETLRGTRRLREDLYHRLRRELYIRIPEVRDRREDIPMFFYLFASREAKHAGAEGLIVDLSAYRLLMDARLPWPGNIRQVQAVAIRSVDCARRSVKDARESGSQLARLPANLVLTRDHVLRVLKNEFKDVRLDDGSYEEENDRREPGGF